MRVPHQLLGSLITLLLLTFSNVEAHPAVNADLEERFNPQVCRVISGVVSKLKKAPAATAYCSSFLSIKTKTVTTTKTASILTTNVITVTTGTNVVTAEAITAAPVTAAPITTTPATVTVTTISPVEVCSVEAIQHKRGASPPCPTILKGLVSSKISEACSCLSIPTPTTTSTVTQKTTISTSQVINVAATRTNMPTVVQTTTPVITPTTTVTVTIPTSVTKSVDPTGIQWAYQKNPYQRKTDNYEEFDSSHFQTNHSDSAVVASGDTQNIGFEHQDCSESTDFYGTQLSSCREFIFQWKGYIFGVSSGKYSIEVTNAAYVAYFWIGDTAYHGFNNDNYHASWHCDTNPGESCSGVNAKFFFPISRDSFTPFRLMLGTDGGAWGAVVKIRDPSGDVIVSTGVRSQGIYQYFCNGAEAPKFRDWGDEA